MDSEIACFSAGSSITTWLQGHPDDPAAYANGEEPHPLHSSTPSKLISKRKALDNISNNAMPGKRRRISPCKGGLALLEEPQTPGQPQLTPFSIPPDNDATPRASEGDAEPRKPRSTNHKFSAGHTSPSRSSASSSARSNSPIKRMGDLQFMDRSVDAVAFEDPEYPLPAAAKKLVENMRKIASGKQVIPDSLKVRYYINSSLSVHS
jgi:hypothetical protein